MKNFKIFLAVIFTAFSVSGYAQTNVNAQSVRFALHKDTATFTPQPVGTLLMQNSDSTLYFKRTDSSWLAIPSTVPGSGFWKLSGTSILTNPLLVGNANFSGYLSTRAQGLTNGSEKFGYLATSLADSATTVGPSAAASVTDYANVNFGGWPTLMGNKTSGNGTAFGDHSKATNREAVAIGPWTWATGLGTIAIGDHARAIPTGPNGNQIVMGDVSFAKGNENFFVGGGAGINHDFVACWACAGDQTDFSVDVSTGDHQGYFGWYTDHSGYFNTGLGFINDWWIGGPSTSAYAHDISLQVPSLIGSNKNGISWRFQGSKATGTGTPGGFTWSLSLKTSSGSTLQTQMDKMFLAYERLAVQSTSNSYSPGASEQLNTTLSNWQSGANTGVGIFGHNIYMNEAGIFTRGNTSAIGTSLAFTNNGGIDGIRYVKIDAAGTLTQPLRLNNDGNFNTVSGGGITWSSSATNANTAGDVGLVRSAAGIMKVSDGSTGLGKVRTLSLDAGTATAGTAPLKFTSGTVLSTPEPGTVQYDGSNFWFNTTTTAGDRVTINPTQMQLTLGAGGQSAFGTAGITFNGNAGDASIVLTATNNNIYLKPGSATGSAQLKSNNSGIVISVKDSDMIFTITRTSCAGAPTGAIANVAGVLNICP